MFDEKRSRITKGRTIRKVMGGRGIFEPQEFFLLSNSLYEFFLSHIFLGLIGVHEFFFI